MINFLSYSCCAILLFPSVYNLTDIHGVDTSREVSIHLLGRITLEILRIKGCCIHDFALNYHRSLGIVRCSIGSIGRCIAERVRVNSISPGWIDTAYTVYEGPNAVQQPVGRVGNPLDIANMVLYLCSDKAGFITGENICIDGGMTHQMIYHADNGWKLEL